MTITPKQIAMARILLDLSQQELADALGIARKTVMRLESGQSPGSAKTLEKIKVLFENKGIEFTKRNGVRESESDMRTLHGAEGFRIFLEDVYNYAKKPNGIACIYNASPSNWIKWVDMDWYRKVHTPRMLGLKKNIEIKIILREGTDTFLGKEYCFYRYFPEKLWNDQTFYAYGSKLAMLNFGDKNLKIIVLDRKEFADGFRVLFNFAWDHLALKIMNVPGVKS